MTRTILKGLRENDKERLLQAVAQDGKRITVIAGLSKNAGKTTFLNWLLERTDFSRKGIITTGRDGEDFDVIEKIRKPKVSIPASAIFTARASAIRKKGGFVHLLEKLPFKAGGKNIWLVKTDFAFEGEITGPPSVLEQIEAAKIMLNYGAEHVFIDGSLDRKAISSAREVDSLIVTGSPVYGSLESLKNGFKRLADLTKIKCFEDEFFPETGGQLLQDEQIKLVSKAGTGRQEAELLSLPYKTLLGHEKEIAETLKSFSRKNGMPDREKESLFLYVPTSLTERSFTLLKGVLQELSHLKIVIKHPFYLQLEEQSAARLIRENALLTLRKMEIAGFVVNSYAVNGNHLDCEQFRETIRQEFTLPVVDVREI